MIRNKTLILTLFYVIEMIQVYKQLMSNITLNVLFIADPELAENLPQISTTENLIQLRQSRFFQVSINTHKHSTPLTITPDHPERAWTVVIHPVQCAFACTKNVEGMHLTILLDVWTTFYNTFAKYPVFEARLIVVDSAPLLLDDEFFFD